MTGPREWRHADDCAFRRGNGSLRGLPCDCGLSAVRDAIAAGHRVVIGPDGALAEPAPVGRDDVAHDEGWAIAIISNVDAPEVGWPQQTEEWRTAARSWLDSVHAPASSDPAPVGLTEAERLHMTNLREAWRRAAPVYTDLAATDVEWLCTLIDRLVPVSPSVGPEEEP